MWLVGSLGGGVAESNQPLPPMDIKQWSAKLTAQQRQACAERPAPSAARESVLAGMLAAATTFRQTARQILADHDVRWPAEFNPAVLRYLAAELGWAL